MHDVLDIIKNIESIYDSNTAFQVLKDFERVLDQLDIYVYKNWEDGELAEGPKIDRHWVTCSFMWPEDKMPDPMGGKRLVDYDCKVSYRKDYLIVPRKIETPDDMRVGTKKGKLDREPVWVVEIQMPKKLIIDILGGSQMEDYITDPAKPTTGVPVTPAAQSAEEIAAASPDVTAAEPQAGAVV
jgi:hypothetical protein